MPVNYPLYLIQLVSLESIICRKRDRIQPKLCLVFVRFDMHMRWLSIFITEESEPVIFLTKHSRHNLNFSSAHRYIRVRVNCSTFYRPFSMKVAQHLTIDVLPHAVYERDGDDLRMALPVDLFTALLGGKVSVPAIDKSVNLTIPAGTRNGKVFRLTGLGMPKIRKPSERGDLYVTVTVELPSKLSDKEKRIVREWQEVREKA